jgi:hypothetical protein
MPKRKKTLEEECEALLRRHKGKRYLRIYVESLIERFAGVEYALRQIQALSTSTSESCEPFRTQLERRDFYTNCFWAFAYSAFDILANIINVVYPLAKDEAWTSFGRALTEYDSLSAKNRGSGSSLPPALHKRIVRIGNSRYFGQLSGFRQCCLHRRAVCVEDEETTVSRSAPYVDWTDSTAPPAPRVVTIICDKADEMQPRFRKRTNLINLCQKIHYRIQDDMKATLRLI